MAKFIPDKLNYLLNNGYNSIDTCYEFSSELHKILSLDECRKALNNREIEVLRDFAEKVKKVDDVHYYTKDKIKNIEKELFGSRGVIGFLKANRTDTRKQAWSF